MESNDVYQDWSDDDGITFVPGKRSLFYKICLSYKYIYAIYAV